MVISASFGLCQSAKSGSFLKFCLCFGLDLAIQASKCWNFRHTLRQTCDLLKFTFLPQVTPKDDPFEGSSFRFCKAGAHTYYLTNKLTSNLAVPIMIEIGLTTIPREII